MLAGGVTWPALLLAVGVFCCHCVLASAEDCHGDSGYDCHDVCVRTTDAKSHLRQCSRIFEMVKNGLLLALERGKTYSRKRVLGGRQVIRVPWRSLLLKIKEIQKMFLRSYTVLIADSQLSSGVDPLLGCSLDLPIVKGSDDFPLNYLPPCKLPAGAASQYRAEFSGKCTKRALLLKHHRTTTSGLIGKPQTLPTGERFKERWSSVQLKCPARGKQLMTPGAPPTSTTQSPGDVHGAENADDVPDTHPIPVQSLPPPEVMSIILSFFDYAENANLNVTANLPTTAASRISNAGTVPSPSFVVYPLTESVSPAATSTSSMASTRTVFATSIHQVPITRQSGLSPLLVFLLCLAITVVIIVLVFILILKWRSNNKNKRKHAAQKLSAGHAVGADCSSQDDDDGLELRTRAATSAFRSMMTGRRTVSDQTGEYLSVPITDDHATEAETNGGVEYLDVVDDDARTGITNSSVEHRDQHTGDVQVMGGYCLPVQ